MLVVFDEALKTGNTLTLSNSALKLGAESSTWPDPLRNIISRLFNGTYHRASQEAIVRSNESISENLGKVCRSTIAGRYPFSSSKKEVKISDFERFFAKGGLVDEYFKTQLADKVDTSSQPWRYKGVDGDNSELEVFERKFSMALTIAVPYLDPPVTQLNMNFDGTQANYAHGPVSPVGLNWPGSRSGSRISITAMPRADQGSSGMIFTGPWALFRWLENAKKISDSDSDDTVLVYSMDKRRADIEVTGLTFDDVLAVDLLKDFRCPGSY